MFKLTLLLLIINKNNFTEDEDTEINSLTLNSNFPINGFPTNDKIPASPSSQFMSPYYSQPQQQPNSKKGH